MEVFVIGLVAYLVVGSVVAAFTRGRSVLDTVLDVALFPVILWDHWRKH